MKQQYQQIEMFGLILCGLRFEAEVAVSVRCILIKLFEVYFGRSVHMEINAFLHSLWKHGYALLLLFWN